MGEASESDQLFARLVVEQGLAKAEHVEECRMLLAQLSAARVEPLPRLGELLIRKGYLSHSQYEDTLRLSQASPASRPSAPAELLPEVASASLDPGNRAGKYVRVSRLGAGAMGEVWKAWDTELRRWVALKFLRGDDPAELARFEREAQTAARLSHPHIAAVYDVGKEGGRPYIAMQLIRGKSLAAFPRGNRRRLVELVRDAASAVHYAHEQGVIHRDLKPHNLMVEGAPSKAFRVYVMDFGLAKQTALDRALSVSGTVLGTPAYMPPEQARGEIHRVDARSDVYALGATLYDLFAGRPPFEDPGVYDLLRRVIEEEPARLPVETDLQTIVMKCLEKDPARRYATAAELADDLSRWLEGDPIRAHPSVEPETRLREFGRALDLKPRYGLALHARAHDLIQQGRLEDAVKDLDTAIEVNPSFGAAYVNRGRARLGLGNLDGAIADCGKALETGTARVIALCNRGIARGQKGDLDGALVDFNQAIEINPRYLHGYYNRAFARVQKRDPDGAVQDLTRAIEIDAQDARSYEFRGDVFRKQGKLDAAISDFTEVLRLQPSSEMYDKRGRALFEKRDFPGAEADFARALELDPKFARAYLNRAAARSNQGNRAGEVQDLRKGLELAPAGASYRAAAEARLKELERR